MASEYHLPEKTDLERAIESPEGVRALAFAESLGSGDAASILAGSGIDWDGMPPVRMRPGFSAADADAEDFEKLRTPGLALEQISRTLIGIGRSTHDRRPS